MAFDKKPSTWLGAGYSLSANNVQMTTATAGSNILLTKLTDAEANATTGDIREVMWAVSYAFYAAWAAISPGNRPAKMTLAKSVVANADLETQTETYTFTFVTDVDPTEVTAEP